MSKQKSSAKSKKVNPRRRPVTQADIQKMSRKVEGAKNEAIHTAWALFMLALGDLEGFDNARMTRVWNRACDYADDMKKGKLTLETVEQTLLDEYRVRLTD